MMNTMLIDEGVSFKDLEWKIFADACWWTRDYARQILEEYDVYLSEHRDKKAYRNKGLRNTVVKTVFGEVEYERRIYQTVRDDGSVAYVYILDEELEIPGVGKMSWNMALQLVNGITDMSYRDCARHISENTGQAISAMGVWNVVQALGERVRDEEAELVKAYKSGDVRGGVSTPVLFEEIDGVYLNMQREGSRKAEMKVAIAYDGWRDVGNGRYALNDKVAVAGFSNLADFMACKDAAISEKYDTDEVRVHVLNGDGAGWIRRSCGGDAVFQLDPFHRNKAIRECIPYGEVVDEVHGYLDRHDVDGMFEYLETYRGSLGDDGEIEKAGRLIRYFNENRDGLIPWTERGLDVPDGHDGLVYRGLGTMENHIWSVIARRMKHNHASWSIRGGDNLAKILARKACGRLGEVADALKAGGFDRAVTEGIGCRVMSAAAVRETEGAGYAYPATGSIPASYGSCGSASRRYWNAVKGF